MFETMEQINMEIYAIMKYCIKIYEGAIQTVQVSSEK